MSIKLDWSQFERLQCSHFEHGSQTLADVQRYVDKRSIGLALIKQKVNKMLAFDFRGGFLESNGNRNYFDFKVFKKYIGFEIRDGLVDDVDLLGWLNRKTVNDTRTFDADLPMISIHFSRLASLGAGPLNWVLSGKTAMFDSLRLLSVNLEWYALGRIGKVQG